MLTMPKKAAAKEEAKTTSETASFKKVMNGFSPDEVNLYISKLRKQNLELKAENDRLSEMTGPSEAVRIEQLEQQLREHDKRLNDANNRAAEAEHKARELEKSGGETADKIKKDLEKRLADTEKRANQAEIQLEQAEARATEAEKRAKDLEKFSKDADKMAKDYEKRIADAEKKAKSSVEKFNKEKELTEMLTAEAGRMAEEIEKLTSQLKAVKAAQAAQAKLPQPIKSVQPPAGNPTAGNAPAGNTAPAKEAIPEKKRPANQGDLIDEQKKLLATAEKKIKQLQEQLAATQAPPSVQAAKAVKEPAPSMSVQNRYEIGFEDFPLPTEEPEPQSNAASFIEEQLSAPVAASHVDTDYSEFQIPTIHLEDEPIFEEAPENFTERKVAASPAAKATAKQPVPKKSKTEEAGERMSRAELKIQIFQEEAEDSYIIPEKYLKMMEDAGHDEDDDFSYLLSDVNPLDDMVTDDEVDDMESLLVGPEPVANPNRLKPEMQRRRFEDNAAEGKKNVTVAPLPRSKSNTP